MEERLLASESVCGSVDQTKPRQVPRAYHHSPGLCVSQIWHQALVCLPIYSHVDVKLNLLLR